LSALYALKQTVVFPRTSCLYDANMIDAVTLTSELIRIDTTNRGSGDCRERPAAEYVAERLGEVGLEALLLESAPGRANVVARIPGSQPGLPALLVHGHLDVVPAETSDWTVPPFSGEIAGGVVWGRGALDMKSMDAMMLAVARAWQRDGRRPARDIVLAFTADEEDTGAYGAGWLVGRHPELFEGCTEAIGESGGYSVHAGLPSGEAVRIYPVATAERGTAWLRLVARGRAGHGSQPNRENAVARLAAAVARIDAYTWPVRLTPTVRAALLGISEALGVRFDTPTAAALGPAGALVQATLANSANPTMLEAGYKINVVPEEAVAYVDGRVLPGFEDEFRSTLDELTGPFVSWRPVHWASPLEAPCDAPIFDAMRDGLLAEDPEAHVVPYCMSGGTDAKHFARLGIACYGYTPLALPPGYDYQTMIHAADERVPVEALRFGTRVLDRFLLAVC
jgi:acetylornithine deacetylase/succinyl-diaminopimelate desuccinylase-like protein